MTGLFNFEGFFTIEARDGIDALNKAREHLPDLILCDIMMPKMNGYDFLAVIRQDSQLRATPFVFLTGRNDDEGKQHGMAMGADAYLTKPVSVEHLLGAVLIALKKREGLQTSNSEKEFNVFLSYSRTDSEIMGIIKNSLVSLNLSVWTDENLEPGTDNWEQAIVDIMKKSGCLAVVLSPDAERSRWVGRELAMAETHKLRIFPILARGDERSAIPIRLISHQWVDIRHNHNEGIEKLVTTIRNHLGLNDDQANR